MNSRKKESCLLESEEIIGVEAEECREAIGDEKKQRKVSILRMETSPINEYEMNNLYFYWTFFQNFPLAQGIPGKGSLSDAWRNHMLRLGSQQIASNTNLLFLAFNQMSRHSTNVGVSMKAKAPWSGGKSSFDSFSAFMETPGLEKELQAALENPQHIKSKGLLNKILDFVVVAGRLVPFGDSERSKGITTMYSQWRWFGLSFFLTQLRGMTRIQL